MTRKPNPKWDDPEESQRFLEAAKAAEASDDPKALDRVLKKIAPRKPSSTPTRHGA
jgi:hypothetical protein